MSTADLEWRVTHEPGRERAWALLMRALYAAGRRHEALVAYQRARRELAESYGIDPGPELRRLEQQILTQDPALDAQRPGAGGRAGATADDEPVCRPPTGADLPGRCLERRPWRQRADTHPPGSGRVRADPARRRGRVARPPEGGSVEYVRAADGLANALHLVDEQAGGGIDAVARRARLAPLLLVSTTSSGLRRWSMECSHWPPRFEHLSELTSTRCRT